MGQILVDCENQENAPIQHAKQHQMEMGAMAAGNYARNNVN